MDKLLICIRCHDFAEFVIDTVSSVKCYSTTRPHIMIAVDNKDMNQIVAPVTKKHSDIGVYVSPELCGWGKGLYKLFCDAFKWAEAHYKFDHFAVIDYDTLFIREGADRMLLDSIEKDTALMGAMQHPHDNWIRVIKKHWDKISKYVEVGKSYEKGRGVLGALMVLTKRGIAEFKERNYFDGVYRNVVGAPLPDDIWVSLLAYSTGLKVKNLWSYTPEDRKYNPKKKVAITWAHPTPIKFAIKGGAYIFHPAKMQSGGKLMLREDRKKEREARQIFAKYRREA